MAYVHHDVQHVARAARQVADSSFANSGQTCCAIKHVLVHQGVLEQFCDRYGHSGGAVPCGAAVDGASGGCVWGVGCCRACWPGMERAGQPVWLHVHGHMIGMQLRRCCAARTCASRILTQHCMALCSDDSTQHRLPAL